MIWSSKDMKTGALIFAIGFALGAFCFSNGASLETMRTSRENWKSRAETAQTELYSLRTNCASEKAQQKIHHDSSLKLKQTELNAAEKALKDIEAVRREEIDKLDTELGYLKERAEEMQKQNAECTVLQQTSVNSIESYTLKNSELLESLLNILSTAANAGESQVADEAVELEIMSDLDEELEENAPEADILDDEPPLNNDEGEAQAELNDVAVGFEPPPRAVANAQIHEEEFHQQINAQQQNEELQMDHPDEYGEENLDEVEEDVVDEDTELEDEFNLEHEMAGVQHDGDDETEEHVEHIPDVQEHPIDPEEQVQAEAELAPPMPKVNGEIVPGGSAGAAMNRLLESEEPEQTSKPKKKRKKRKKKKSSSGV